MKREVSPHPYSAEGWEARLALMTAGAITDAPSGSKATVLPHPDMPEELRFRQLRVWPPQKTVAAERIGALTGATLVELSNETYGKPCTVFAISPSVGAEDTVILEGVRQATVAEAP